MFVAIFYFLQNKENPSASICFNDSQAGQKLKNILISH